MSEREYLRMLWQWCCLALVLGLPVLWCVVLSSEAPRVVRFVWTGDEAVYEQHIAPTLAGANATVSEVASSDGTASANVIAMDFGTHVAWVLHVIPKKVRWGRFKAKASYLDPQVKARVTTMFEFYSANPVVGRIVL